MIIFRLFIISVLTIIAYFFLTQFFFCTQYTFKSSTSFKGKTLYNPYDSLRSGNWLKCNFHAHANAWKGITNGKGTAEEIHHAYDSLHYDVHCISNYHSIDSTSINSQIYIPAYEHGYNISKTHQLVLGDKKVCWLDYILPQTLSNKQDVLNYLATDTQSLVILNHPKIRNGYRCQDFSYLSNYHCMEVLNPAGNSFLQWDAALSAGKPIFIVGDDDLHNIISKDRLGRMCTYVNVKERNQHQVLHALKKGRGFGVIIGPTQHPDSIPMLNYLVLKKDTIQLQMNTKASTISFTGQNGQILASFSQTANAKYVIREKDHYARASIDYPNGTSIYLNPVFYTNSTNLAQTAVYPNIRTTLIYRTIGFSFAGFWLFGVFVFIQGKRTIYITLPFNPDSMLKKRFKKRNKPTLLT
ncbi:CehA/McbA family metallohydrolase domain-containing protein [Arcticibacter eurypsychrophilus]|uniref:hypothetical protein n=1 Tax=Arcticibacter eurypsychrophilus TaxID=1434752 RepID=UPI000AADEA5E|nr:hypothetical protein [Arcticibacter eurypsychrophilus]